MGAPQGEEVMASGEAEAEQAPEVEEFSAPPGWKKKVTPRRGGAFRRGDTSFVAPDGDEIKSKRQLERYLKANPGGPSLADFDWSTGETPRRSERLSSRKRPSDFEPEPVTTPRRTRKKKNNAAAPATGEETEEGKEDPAKDEPPTTTATTTTTVAEENKEQAQEEVPEAVEDVKDSAEEAKGVDVNPVKAPPAISCAKTETLTKSQEAQPAQIGVS